METIIKSQRVQIVISKPIEKTKSTNFWNEMEFNRFGIIPVVLLVVACLGGIAAGFGAKTDIIKLSIIAFPTILTLAFVLAVAPMRTIFWAAFVSVILQFLVLMF